MRYRKMGGLDLSVIAFGTGDTAGALVTGDPAEQREVVGHALEHGINVFDASPDYGKGTAEVNLGRTLREVGGQDALVMTKVEIMPEHLSAAGAEGRVDVAARVVESVNDSLTRLRRDHVDVLVLHNPCRHRRNPAVRLPWTPLTPADVLGDVLAGMDEVLHAGKARALGAACERAEVSAVREILASGRFDLIDIWFNLANPSAGRAEPVPGIPPEQDYTGLLAAAAERGVGVGVIRPLAGGALTSAVVERGVVARHRLSTGYFTWHPELLEPEIARGRRFAALDRPGEQTLAEVAYRYLLGHDAVTTVVGGFSDTTHIDDAVRAVDAGPLSEPDAREVERVIGAGFTDPGLFTPPIYSGGPG